VNEQDPPRILRLDDSPENADWLRSPEVQGHEAHRKRAEANERGQNGVRYTEQADQSPDATLDNQEATNGQAEESI
jgi:hypothetical protein